MIRLIFLKCQTLRFGLIFWMLNKQISMLDSRLILLNGF